MSRSARSAPLLRPLATPRVRFLQLALLVTAVASGAEPARAAEVDSALFRGSAEGAPESPLWLRLRGGVQRGSEPSERVFGVLELGVAFDLLVAGRARAFQTSLEPWLASPGADGSSQESPLRPPRLELTSELARATLEAAARAADAADPDAPLDSMLSRTRSSASLPELRLAAGTSRDQSLRLTPTLNDPAKFTRDGGRDLWFEARLTWHLERALFSRDEIAIARLKAQASERRSRLLRQVLDALIDWQRARQALRSELLGEQERSAAELHELEARLRLDAWTEGWFSLHLERSGASPPQIP